MAKRIMVQGTTSYAGKSFLVMALCRIFREKGYRVAPFKSQNTSLNSYVTPDGRELARAQALQAFAAGIEPRVEMNPILIKPKGESRAQLIVNGRPVKDLEARNYYKEFVLQEGVKVIQEAYRRLEEEYDLIVIEGAGSPAEINLYEQDIANMRVADMTDSPVLLVADIDRGGVFASIYGTIKLLKPRHQARIKGIVINKFRGDVGILEPGIKMIEDLVGKPVLGILPYIKELQLPDEDSMALDGLSTKAEGGPEVAVIRLPRISNFTDLDPFIYDGIRVRYVESPGELGSPGAIVIPGTKNTVDDLRWLRGNGLGEKIKALAGKVPIVGLCGGFQILGKKIFDEKGLEGSGTVEGLGLLDVETRFETYQKVTQRVRGRVVARGGLFQGAEGGEVYGYEIHMGQTRLGKDAKRLLEIDGRMEGAVSSDGMVFGTYVHGIFDAPTLRGALMRRMGWEGKSARDARDVWRESIARAAEIVEERLDMGAIEGILEGE